MALLNMALLLLFASLAMFAPASAQIPEYVILLDYDNFEHDTQATTGQTAGHWFVLFNSRLSHRKFAVRALWDSLAKDEDKEVIFAEVDLDTEKNKPLARQFESIQPPEAVLFRDRQMYVYPGSLTAEGAAESVREFWQGTYANVAGQPVPGVVAARTMPASLTPEDPKQESSKFWKNVFLGGLLVIAGISLHAAALLKHMRQQAAEKKAKAAQDPLAPAAKPGASAETKPKAS